MARSRPPLQPTGRKPAAGFLLETRRPRRPSDSSGTACEPHGPKVQDLNPSCSPKLLNGRRGAAAGRGHAQRLPGGGPRPSRRGHAAESAALARRRRNRRGRVRAQEGRGPRSGGENRDRGSALAAAGGYATKRAQLPRLETRRHRPALPRKRESDATESVRFA